MRVCGNAQDSPFGEIALAARPLDGTLWLSWPATGPVAELETHGRLRVVLAAVGEGVGVPERADGDAVDDPLDPLGGPVDGVGVEGFLGARDGEVDGAIVGGGVAFAEEVGLDLRRVSTQEFPAEEKKSVRVPGYIMDADRH